MTKELALDLAKLGLHVFPCREKEAVINERVYDVKSPYPTDGFYSATTDPERIAHFWTEHPAALVGVWTGASGLVVLDIDVKRDAEGRITVDGYDELDKAWLEIPDTFSYTSSGGEGKHLVYAAPEGEQVAPGTKYRKMPGVDRRSGGSYVVWAGPVPKSRSEFTPAPEWFLDATEVRSAAAFEGEVKDWFDSLTPGDPNVLVRRAIDRVQDDMSHQEMVSAQYEAVRLGAEGNPGVPELLARLEEAWLNRDPDNHTTPESQWQWKFAEALASGIKEHGGAISLVKGMPTYSPDLAPPQVSDTLLSGYPGDKNTFNRLLRELVQYEDNDMKVLSVLWNAPTVRDLSRDWGLQFTMKRVQDARVAPPPASENPSLETTTAPPPEGALLTPEERDLVSQHPTFIDEYLEASANKGFHNPEYDIPAAWTLLSMAFGGKAFLPKGVKLGVNLWFNILGYSGTGKSSSDDMLKACLDLLLKGGEGPYYNVGANSSPEAIHEVLLDRDRQASMVHHDEASDFFEGIRKKDWMASLKDQMSKWYMGYVDPMQKVRLKEQRGKSAVTSFNIHMLATPDRLLGLIDTGMFETGFLSRFNWVWGSPPETDDVKYLVSRSTVDDDGINPKAYDLVTDLLLATRWLPTSKSVPMDWTEEAEDRIIAAHMAMDNQAKTRPYYNATEPAITRLGRDTVWKCAALLALYRGEKIIRIEDARAAIYYTERWFLDMFRVVGAAGEGDYQRVANAMAVFVASSPNGVTQASLYHRFGKEVKNSQRELDDRIGFLLTSGRIIKDPDGNTVRYKINGGGTK